MTPNPVPSLRLPNNLRYDYFLHRAAGSDLSGRPVEDVHQTGEVRVIALQRPGTDRVDWSPARRRLLAPQDRIYVLATRAGLSRVLARSQPAPA